MKLIKTVKCKLQVDKDMADILRETLNRFAECCNDIRVIAEENGTTNKVELQHLCYHELKAKYQLQANLIIRAIARVATALKGKRPSKVFRPTSMDLDARTFSFIERKEEISISTYAGRKHIKLALGNFQRGLLKGQKPKAATLSYNRNKKVFYINICLETEVIVPSGGNPVGVDRGLYNIATTSNGQTFSGKQVMHVRKHYSKLRQRLQSKGTKSAKRRLKLLSGKESRYMKDINHCISKAIVANCKAGDMLVLEELTYIRDRVKSARSQRLIMHSWTFAQLQQFIEYKANAVGIPVMYIDPRYTSQRCSRCDEIGIRNKHKFWCPHCNMANNADFNAAYNIRKVSLTLSDGLLSASQT